MRGRGRNTGYNTGSGNISILSKEFNVSGTVIASTLTTSTLNCIDTVLNTNNNIYVKNEKLYLNQKLIGGINIDPYELTVNTTPEITVLSYRENSVFTVPPGITEIEAQVWGAGGGYYGNGAYIRVRAQVTPGDEYTIIVGAGGPATTGKLGGGKGSVAVFSYGGDNEGSGNYLGGPGGGGYSALMLPNTASTIIVLAGGGGGASYNIYTGAYSHAGILTGYSGGGLGGGSGGGPGTQTQGGPAGISTDLSKGSSGTSGATYKATFPLEISDGGKSILGNGGGGGGGGYYSGGGGSGSFISIGDYAYFGGGGGGGSSYISTGLTTILAIDGTSTLVYSLEEHYQPGIGIGGTHNGTHGTMQMTSSGGQGLVVISYSPTKNLDLTSPYPEGRFTADNIQTKSTITNNLTFDTQKPISIYANNNGRYIFNATGEEQYFRVPDGVTQLNVKLWGAAGYGLGTTLGGYGGYVTGILPVNPGDELTIIVGTQGGNYNPNINANPNGGFGGGGDGALGGGGRSAITDGSTDLVTAGGGGGASLLNNYCYGGAGGNYTGQPGILLSGYTSVGYGGTQTEGGQGGLSVLGGLNYENYQGIAGTEAYGGRGAYVSSIASFFSTSGSGGGGGYYGGGGGGGYFLPNFQTYNEGPGIGGAGGGGSSYLENLINPYGLSGFNYKQYMTDPDYEDGVGLIDGRVVISFTGNLNLEYTDPYAQIAVSQKQLPRNGWVAGGQGNGANANYGNYGLQWSTDGVTWNYITSGGFEGQTNGVAFNDTTWIAVGSSTIGADETYTIQTSPDGVKWSPVNSGGFLNAYGITWGNGIWVAAGEGNYPLVNPPTLTSIQISRDGLNWSNTINSFEDIAYGVSYNTIDKTYVAVGHCFVSPHRTILYSKDAINWYTVIKGGFRGVTLTSPISNVYYNNSNGLGIANNNLGGISQLWIAVGGYGGNPLGTIQYSGDGSNFSNIATGGFVNFGRGIAYGSGMWVATGDSTQIAQNPKQTIQWSVDGVNWNNAYTGGFSYSGNSVAYNGRLWVATGLDAQQFARIQVSTDGSNWSNSQTVVSVGLGVNGIAQGVLKLAQNNYTFFTNSEVTTQTVNANYANIDTLDGNYITFSNSLTGNMANLNYATISNLNANYGNIGDFYKYSYVKDIIRFTNGFNSPFIAIGAAKEAYNSIQTSVDGINWAGVNYGGFSPVITYSQKRIRNTSIPKALLYDTAANQVVAYGLTNEAVNFNNFTSTIQYTSDGRNFSNYTGVNTLNKFILENINDAVYVGGKYVLLTSIADSPILVSQTKGEFYLGNTQNGISYTNGFVQVSSLSAAYGFYTNSETTYIVGTANSSDTSTGNSPIFRTTTGTIYGRVTTQANLPPTFYDITGDSTNNNILFIVGPGIPNGTTSLKTFMYSTDKGETWEDGGLEGVISARSVSWGSNPITHKKMVVVACETKSSSNTIISYTYTGSFNPYIPNTLTNNVVSILSSSDSGNSFARANSGGFSTIGNCVTYEPSIPLWIAGGDNNNSRNLLVSGNGAFWGDSFYGISSCPINTEVFGLLATTGGFGGTTTLLYVAGKSTTPGLTLAIGILSGNTYTFSPILDSFDNAGYGIAAGGAGVNRKVVAVGEGQASGTILCAINGGNMSKQGVTGAFGITGYGITYANTQWVAVGNGGSATNILYSQNGSNWSNTTGGFDIEGRGIVYRGTVQTPIWVAVGKGVITSNILYSSDGRNWFNANTPTFSNIGYSVTWDGVQNFVAVGDSGTLKSSDGSNWSKITSGDFNSQIINGPRITVVESVGRGIASDGSGKLVSVGAASNTNRVYNWSNINVQTTFGGFSSMLSEDGNTLEKTYLATKTLYDTGRAKFIVAGLTNNSNTCIVTDSTSASVDLNIWTTVTNASFDATNELQFINSCNRTVVANEVTTNILNASNGYVSQSLSVTNNTNTYTLNTTNVNSSNIYNTSNIYTSNIYTSNMFSAYVSTNVISANIIDTQYAKVNKYLNVVDTYSSSITVSSITVTNHLGNYANITSISTGKIVAVELYGDGTNIDNVTASELKDRGGIYNIQNTDFKAKNITATTFTGSFIGNIITPGPLTDDVIGTNILTASTITTYGNIIMTGTGGIPGRISGDGSGLIKVTASNLQLGVDQNIGNATFAAGRFIGDGSGLTGLNIPPAPTSVAYATNATNANNAVNASYAAYGNPNLPGRIGIGFNAGGRVIARGGFQALDNNNMVITTIDSAIECVNRDAYIKCSGPIQGADIQGNTITATTGFVGDGSRMTFYGLNVTGQVNIENQVRSPNGNVTIYKTTIGKNLFIPGTISAYGGLSANNGTNIYDGASILTGAFFVNESIQVKGAGTIESGLTVYKGLIIKTGNLTLTDGSISANGLITANNGLYAYNGTNIYGGASILTGAFFVNESIQVKGAGTIESGLTVYNGLTMNTGNLNVTDGYVTALGYHLVSDKRLKTNIKPLKDVLSRIKQLNGTTYNYINTPHNKTTTTPNETTNVSGITIGLIAQDVEKIFPEVVCTDSSPEGMKSINYNGLIPILIEGMKEQQAIIDSQAAEISKLKATVQAILRKYPL